MTTINDVRVLRVSDPSHDPGLDVVQDIVLVAAVDEHGMTGYGESQTSPALLAAVLAAPASRVMGRSLKSLVIGRPCADADDIMADLRAVTRVVGREGLVAHALSALEMAICDLRAKIEAKPLWKLLADPGLEPEGPRAYGTTWFTDSPPEMDASLTAVNSLGQSGVKVAYPRGAHPSIPEEASVLRRLRDRLGPEAGLHVDWQSQGTVDDLLRRMALYNEVKLGWIEEPFDRDALRDYEKLAASSPIPLAAGESETRLVGFQAFLDAGVTVLQPDLGRCGLRVASEVAVVSKAAGVAVVPHQWGSDLNRAANVHWAIAMGLGLTERRLDPAPLADSLIRWDLPMRDIRYDIPVADGIGVRIDSAAFERLI